MTDKIILDDFIFYLNDNKVAIAIDDMSIDACQIIYDGKNILCLKTADNQNYILQNIVPPIRQVLKKSSSVMIVFTKGSEISDAYELELSTDESLFEADTFFDEASKVYQEISHS